MTVILAARADEARAQGEALIQEADNLTCQSWNERMWSDGSPIDLSPTILQAVNGGFPWLEIECSRCRTHRDVDLAALRRPPTTCVHDHGASAPAARGIAKMLYSAFTPETEILGVDGHGSGRAQIRVILAHIWRRVGLGT
jgi:hypothetical protein